MIRKIERADIEEIIRFLNEEMIQFDESWAICNLSNENNVVFVCEDMGNIRGFFMLMPKEEFAGIIVYVREDYRGQGIGSNLMKVGMELGDNLGFKKYRTEIRTEKFSTGDFFIKEGFTKHFGYINMVHNGERVQSSFQMEKYREELYEQYKEVYEECFYDMRKALDIKPYRDCDSREIIKEKMDKIYVFLKDGELIASVLLDNGDIDDLIVKKEYQGKGYGTKLIEFSIEHFHKRGIKDINLGVAEWNERAINLYKKAHFDIYISGEFLMKN